MDLKTASCSRLDKIVYNLDSAVSPSYNRPGIHKSLYLY